MDYQIDIYQSIIRFCDIVTTIRIYKLNKYIYNNLYVYKLVIRKANGNIINDILKQEKYKKLKIIEIKDYNESLDIRIYYNIYKYSEFKLVISHLQQLEVLLVASYIPILENEMTKKCLMNFSDTFFFSWELDKIMKNYENVNKDFFYCVLTFKYIKLSNHFDELLGKGKYKFGYIFDLDNDLRTYVWTSLFCNLKTGEIYYFSSLGQELNENIIKIIRDIKEYCE